ncbi:sensor histidine kinase [Candidatus Solirubrobacter pratensis]|uniref:sensor histidine kinase n=1 Tax=Candidatus Solirubrobacter pratensis TaxID=1298857 RepID=UPI000422FB5A|nr:GAF domain-containing protein [Candidatus Solirubrobacter pratensis]
MPDGHEAILVEEQASLRRVAALAAGGAPPAQVFAAIAEEVAHVLRLPLVATFRYDADDAVTVVGAWGERPHPLRAGTRWPLGEESLVARVLRSGRPARVDDVAELRSPIAAATRPFGVLAVAGAPIVVDGRVWGVIAASPAGDRPLPDHIEERLAGFTELVATAISNSQAREELRRLADEQAALLRVATLVAEGATPDDVFAAVAREAAEVLNLPLIGMYRYEPDGTATVAGATGNHPFQPGTNWPLDGPTAASLVRRTGRPARVEDYADVPGVLGEAALRAGFRAGVGAPIVVDGRLWGSVCACADQRMPLPPDAESHLNQFTALVATAISNTQAHADLRRLADERAALQRLATMVADGADPQVVFDGVCEETGRVLEACSVNLVRFIPDGFSLTVAGWSPRGEHVPAGTRLPLDGESVNVLVRDTGEPARMDSYADASGALAEVIRHVGVHSEVGAPVLVEGRVWGALIAGTSSQDPLPPGTERRLARFADLIATAVSHAATREELFASRARIVEAADEQRRQVVRDLHDGAQQRLVHTLIILKLTLETLRRESSTATPAVEEAIEEAQAAMRELRELSHGILPADLTHGGLRAGLNALASRASVPVALEVPSARFAASVEATAYFLVAEALTNVSKHAQASQAWVTVTVEDGALRVEVRDDGIGGASATGSGMVGMQDRVTALEGRLRIVSPPGRGTVVVATLPLSG